MLQGGYGLLLLLQPSMVHLSLSQKLLRFLHREAHGGGVRNISLKTGQKATTLFYLKKMELIILIQKQTITLLMQKLPKVTKWFTWFNLDYNISGLREIKSDN